VTCFGGAVLVLFGFNRPAFLLGHVHPKGVWFYYPVVFVLKAPLGFLGLLLLQLWLGVYRGKKGLLAGLQVEWRVLWVTLVVFTVVCVLSGFDINIRHFSVPITLLILLLAPMPGLIGEIRFGWVAVAALVASCLMITALAWPWYLPYVNALGSGRPAYELMSDSNVDWNQALPEVERFTEPGSGAKRCRAVGGGIGKYDSGQPQLRVVTAVFARGTGRREHVWISIALAHSARRRSWRTAESG